MITFSRFYSGALCLVALVFLPHCGTEQRITPVQHSAMVRSSLEGDNTDAANAPDSAAEHTGDANDVSGTTLAVTSHGDEEAAHSPDFMLERTGDFGTLGITPDEEQALGHKQLTALLGDGGPMHHVACAGPWRYTSFDCFKKSAGHPCGVLSEEAFEEIVEYNGCTRPMFGQVGMAFNDKVYVERAIETEYAVNMCRDDGRIFAEQAVIDGAARQCSELNTAAMQGPQPGWSVTCSNLRRQDDVRGPGGASCRWDGVHSYVWWSAEFTYMQPTYAYRDSDPACGRKMPARTRKIKERTYNTCRNENFGREMSNVCGAREQTVFSPTGMSRYHLWSTERFFKQGGEAEAICLTCEPTPYGTDEEAAAKMRCFASSRGLLQELKIHSDAGSQFAQKLGPAALLQDVHLRTRVLFEAHYTPEFSGDDVLGLYAPEGEHNDDDIMYKPGVSLPQSEGFKARTHLCRTLLQHHVDPRRIAAEYDACLQLATLTDTEKTARVRVESRLEALKLGVSLFARYVRSMQDGAQQDSTEALNAHKMVQAWYAQAQQQVPFVSESAVAHTSARMRAYANRRTAQY